MWRILLDSLKQGVQPPYDPDGSAPLPVRFRGMVMIDPDRCDRTGACAKACPTGAITLTDDPAGWQVDHAKCIFCPLCQEACPTGAITLGLEHKLAVRDKNDLTVSVSFPEGDPS